MCYGVLLVPNRRSLFQVISIGCTTVYLARGAIRKPLLHVEWFHRGIKHYALEKHDADILMSETVWLTSTIIAASQSVLKSMIPAGQTLLFKTGELIQILHCCSENWLTVSTVAAQHLPEGGKVSSDTYPG